MKKTGLSRLVYNFFVSYKIIDVSDFENNHRYLMKKHNIVKLPGFIEQIFIVLAFVFLCLVNHWL